jgi:hypothetical protein
MGDMRIIAPGNDTAAFELGMLREKIQRPEYVLGHFTRTCREENKPFLFGGRGRISPCLLGMTLESVNKYYAARLALLANLPQQRS